MIPEGQEAEYFSLYEISERGTSWLGPLCSASRYNLRPATAAPSSRWSSSSPSASYC